MLRANGNGIRTKRWSVIAALAVIVPATAHAVDGRLEQQRSERELIALTDAIGPIAVSHDGERHVTLNGASMIFKQSTEQRPLDDVMAAVTRDCASADRDVAFGDQQATGDGPSPVIHLERVVTQESTEGVRAALCIFAPERSDRDDPAAAGEHLGAKPMPRVRYTLARRVDAQSTSVTTVVSTSATPLAELFPAEGDAPGSDLAGVARPERARRTLTALVGFDDQHSVRIYESTLPLHDAIASYDASMRGLGFEITGTLPDARMYRRAEVSFVASFLRTADGCAIAVAPFDAGAPRSNAL